MAQHRKSVHGKVFKCNKCNFVSNKSNLFNAHLKNFHKNQQSGTMCHCCDWVGIDLKRHLFSEHNYCADCKLQWRSKILVLDHCREKHAMPTRCQDCPFLGFEWELKAHMSVQHGTVVRKFALTFL